MGPNVMHSTCIATDLCGTSLRQLCKVDVVITQFIQHTIILWRTKIILHTADGTIKMVENTITCGIFQFNSFSPLIFYMVLFPLSRVLNKVKLGYVLCKNKISNLLYIDDLKLYARNEEKLRRALQIVQDFSNDINMTLRLDKYAILLITNGKYATANICPEIPKLDDDKNKGYWYLGIMEGVGFHMKE
eukprot:10387739-Ditylum_brightwellii.AAC.1